MRSEKILQIKPLGFPWATQDPFLFCAYHRDVYPEGNDEMGVEASEKIGRNIGSDFTLKDGYRMYHGSAVPGFPYHPHKGFETITINKEGFVDHSDSLGAAGRFGAGDVQWMTAGKGILHSEMFPLLNQEEKNPLEIFQVWLNLPKSKKLVDPHFKMLWADMVPVVQQKDEQDNTTTIDIVAGQFADTVAPSPTPNSWAADQDNGVCVLTIKMDAQAEWNFPATQLPVHRTLYFYKGQDIKVEDELIQSNHLIELKSNENVRIKNGDQEAYFLMLQGKPINEPIAQHGPFVMNTQQEIQEAFAEYRRTQFGGWPWPMQEQIHPRDKGRFALHADGREEVK